MSEESKLELSKKITYAVQNEDSVVIQYQPIHNHRTAKIEKYEVLMRLNIDGELIYPKEFLPHSKKINQYKELSKIAIEKSFIYFSDKDICFSINLSIIDISDKEFHEFFFAKIKEHNVARKLTIEFVEPEGVHKTEEFFDFIKKVKSLNCKIALDDFGIGYSNLTYILEMSDYIDYLKFDACLIKDIVENTKVQKFVESLIYLCDTMRVMTIAEFVDNHETFKFLESIGVDYSQGYHIGAPQSSL